MYIHELLNAVYFVHTYVCTYVHVHTSTHVKVRFGSKCMCYVCMDSHVQCTYVRTHSMLVIILFVSYSLERFGGQAVEQKEQTIIFTEGSQSFAESKLFTCTYVCFLLLLLLFQITFVIMLTGLKYIFVYFC